MLRYFVYECDVRMLAHLIKYERKLEPVDVTHIVSRQISDIRRTLVGN